MIDSQGDETLDRNSDRITLLQDRTQAAFVNFHWLRPHTAIVYPLSHSSLLFFNRVHVLPSTKTMACLSEVVNQNSVPN